MQSANPEVEELAAFYQASRTVERQEFTLFSQAQHRRLLHAQALEWAPRVRREERAEFERRAQIDLPGFRITERDAQDRMILAAEREEYFPVFFIDPPEGNRAAVGFDLASEAIRRDTLERARDSGEALATPAITLVQENGTQYAFLLVHPIFAKGVPVLTPEQRRRHLTGYVLGVYRIGDLIEAALNGLKERGIDVELRDLDAPPDRQLLYRHRETDSHSVTRDRSPSLDLGLWREEESCQLTGHRWQAIAIPSADWAREDHSLAFMVSGLILFATLLTLVFLSHLMRRNRQLRQNAEVLRRNQTRLDEAQ